MLPIFRLIPVGGVFLAIAILLLALNPPRTTSRPANEGLVPARGALIDRNEHPEWRQFLIISALRRAGEVERLRDLRDTIVRTAPPAAIEASATTQAPPTVADLPVATEPEIKALQADASSEPGDAVPITAAPQVAEAEPVPPAPQPAVTPKPAASPPKPVVETSGAGRAMPVAAAPKTIAPTPVTVTPEREAPTQVASVAPPTAERAQAAPADHAQAVPATPPQETPVVAAAPEPAAVVQAAAPAAAHETNGTRVGPDQPSPAAPAAVKVAVLPAQMAEQNNDDITGSIDQSPEHGTTIPVDIGEASSTEIELSLPRERPPVLRELDLRRANQSKVEHLRRRAHRTARAKDKKTKDAPLQFDFFAMLFRTLEGDGAFSAAKPYSPSPPGKLPNGTLPPYPLTSDRPY